MASYFDQLTWVAVDTETSGTNPYAYEVIEIGAVRFSLKGIEEKFQVLIRTKKKHDPRSQEIHNISEEEIEKEGIAAGEALKQFVSFISDDPLVFHNASFDISFLTLEMERNKLEPPKNTYYDTLYLSRTYFPDRKSHSLSNLKRDLGIEVEKSHRALHDAEATAQVFLKIIQNHYEEISSKKKYNSFMRYHRKVNKFEIKFPKNMDEIDKYFKRYINTGNLLRVQFKTREDEQKNLQAKIKEIMIFNQSVFIKILPLGEEDDTLVPLKKLIIFDPDKGYLKGEDLIQ